MRASVRAFIRERGSGGGGVGEAWEGALVGFAADW